MRVTGTVAVPGDKSISHRALILAALADGSSEIRAVLRSADVAATAAALRALGVDVAPLADRVAVRGAGRDGLRAPATALDCGNSGTSARLLAGVVAGAPIAADFVGDASLSRRPMGRVARPLSAMGARITLAEGGTLPMRVEGGALREIAHASDAASAQVKSAVLLAAVVGGVAASVREPAPSRDHTERMLAARGVPVRRAPCEVGVEPAAAVAALDVRVPGDPSSAAFLVAAAALADAGGVRLPDVCVNPTRTGFLGALARMGAPVALEDERDEGGEPVATLVARPGALVGASIDGDEVPSLIDELPLVACLAARADGETVVRGAAELRVKESDRIAAVVANLRAIGADADELPDGFVVRGGRQPLRGRVTTHGDHRLAMAFGVLAAMPGTALQIDDTACVGVSYPDFWTDLARITG